MLVVVYRCISRTDTLTRCFSVAGIKMTKYCVVTHERPTKNRQDSMNKTPIQQLVQTSLALFPGQFNIEEFILERAFANVAAHVRIGNVTLVWIEYNNIEEFDGFADGGVMEEQGDIWSRTHWLLHSGGEENPRRFSVDFRNKYEYGVHGHSGGVSWVTNMNTWIGHNPDGAFDWLTSHQLKGVLRVSGISSHSCGKKTKPPHSKDLQPWVHVVNARRGECQCHETDDDDGADSDDDNST